MISNRFLSTDFKKSKLVAIIENTIMTKIRCHQSKSGKKQDRKSETTYDTL